MKNLYLALLIGILSGCSITKDGIIINTPTVPTVSFCQNVASDDHVATMANKIESQTFPDEKLSRARMITKDYCFVSEQVLVVLDAFVFDDNKLTIAKELYHQTTDKSNYEIIIDSFVHKSHRDELMDYISQNT